MINVDTVQNVVSSTVTDIILLIDDKNRKIIY